MDWLDLLAVQRTLKSLLQHHSSKASILQRSAFFIVQLPYSHMTTGKTIAFSSRWTFVGKVKSLLFNMLSRLVIAFLPRSKRLSISWLQSPSVVILEPPLPKKSWGSKQYLLFIDEEIEDQPGEENGPKLHSSYCVRFSSSSRQRALGCWIHTSKESSVYSSSPTWKCLRKSFCFFTKGE